MRARSASRTRFRSRTATAPRPIASFPAIPRKQRPTCLRARTAASINAGIWEAETGKWRVVYFSAICSRVYRGHCDDGSAAHFQSRRRFCVARRFYGDLGNRRAGKKNFTLTMSDYSPSLCGQARRANPALSRSVAAERLSFFVFITQRERSPGTTSRGFWVVCAFLEIHVAPFY